MVSSGSINNINGYNFWCW